MKEFSELKKSKRVEGLAEGFIFSLLMGILTLLYVIFLVFGVMKHPTGNKKMQEIASAIRRGAGAYLKRQYTTVAVFVIILFALIGYFISWLTAEAFVLGAFLSALAGYVGMMVSVRANVRTAQAAQEGLSSALRLSFIGGAVTGLTLVGLGLVGISLIYLMTGSLSALIGFGFGASLISLFARVGGGIYTKAADVGADLVGKVEKGIPEDDPRNPAVIADNVGDNVGDCAGMAADLFESFVVTIIAAMLLALGLYPNSPTSQYIEVPLVIASLGAISTVLGTHFVRLGRSRKVMKALYKGVVASAVFMLVGVLIYALFLPSNYPRPEILYSAIVGVVATMFIGLITEYYTAKEYRPVKSIAEAAKTGAGTNLISGLAVGLQSTALPLLVVVGAIIFSFKVSGIFGVAIAATSMLSLTGMIIALDAFGPITDNAGGIAEMSKLPENVRRVTDELDAVGNTTKATTKGFAIAGAALSALVLFVAFSQATGLKIVNILSPSVTVGLLIGGLLPFLFASFLMKAVGNAAFEVVEEVRRQFHSIKGLMAGTGKPDYEKCVDICTKAALHELMVPGLLAVLSPIIVGYLFGAEALAGMLAGAIVTGFLLAIFMATAGAAWDNAKKYVEDGKYGGKGSDAHKAAVVGDTVGDPMKDTCGPSLNALIKVLNTVSLIFAGVIVANSLHLI